MNAGNDLRVLVDDLAGHWTEPVLEILKATGFRPVSVDRELAAWRTLKKILHSELRWQHAFRLPTLVTLSTVMEQVLRKAVLLMAQKLEPDSISYEFESRVGRLAGDRRSTAAERRVYAQIVRQPALRASFKPPSRTDFTPRLRVSALSG